MNDELKLSITYLNSDFINDSFRPDDEIFYCEATKEVFRDYEEFFQRTILCNSLVWSCSITGKAGLTYEEAVDCEKKAR